MNAKRFLKTHGWRHIGKAGGGVRPINYWDHAQHQPDLHGAFTTYNATKHQHDFMLNEHCDCIQGEQPAGNPATIKEG